MVAAYLVWMRSPCDWLNVALSLLVLVCLHAGTNILGDCRDHETGVDFPGAPNGVCWIFDGRFTVRELRRFAFALLGIGVALGLVVVLRSSLDVVWIGAAGVAIALGYPFLKYHALGDVAVFLAFTVLPSIGFGMVAVGEALPELILVTLPSGVQTVAILNANNIRDVVSDARAGCRTLPLVLGDGAAKWLFCVEVLVPYLAVLVMVWLGLVPRTAMSVFLSAPFAVGIVAALLGGRTGDVVIPSAQLQFVFAVLQAISFPVGMLGAGLQAAALCALACVFLLISIRGMRRVLCVGACGTGGTGVRA